MSLLSKDASKITLKAANPRMPKGAWVVSESKRVRLCLSDKKVIFWKAFLIWDIRTVESRAFWVTQDVLRKADFKVFFPKGESVVHFFHSCLTLIRFIHEIHCMSCWVCVFELFGQRAELSLRFVHEHLSAKGQTCLAVFISSTSLFFTLHFRCFRFSCCMSPWFKKLRVLVSFRRDRREERCQP